MKEQACFWLDEDGDATICYEKQKFLNNERSLERVFIGLVNAIQNPDGALENFVAYSDELELGWGGKDKILKDIREIFSWIKKDSLVYIVEGEKYSVVLLDKGSNNGYALFLNKKESKFFFSYEIEKHYEPIDIGWVNGGYTGGIHISLKPFWRSSDNPKCQFKKANVALYANRSIDGNENYICDFGEYQLIKTKSDSVVKLNNPNESLGNEQKLEQVYKPTIRFIKWISS